MRCRTRLAIAAAFALAAIGGTSLPAAEGRPAPAEPAGPTLAPPERPRFTLPREARPAWLREEGIVMAGSWEPLLFRVRRDGRPGYEATPEERAAYGREHSVDVLRELRALGVNFILLHGYKGFGLEAEKASMEDAKAFAELCRREGFRTGTYIFSGTIGWELLFRERPDAEDWVVRDASGKPIPYGSATYRYYLDRNHPEAVAYLRRPVRFALEEMRVDLLHFDNYHVGPGHGPRAAEAFRAWIAERYAPEALAERVGPGGLGAVAPPFDSSPAKPLGRDYLRFSCAWLARSYWDLARYARGIRPEILLECNPGGVGDRTRPPVDHGELLRGGEAFWDEGPGPGWDGAALRTRIRSYKVGRSLGNMTFAYTRSALEAAEAIAFNLDCLGCVAWFEYGRIAAWPGSKEAASRELRAWADLFRRVQRRWGGRSVIADVAALRPFAAQVFGSAQATTHRAEEALIESHVPFGILGELTRDSLRGFRAALAAGCEILSGAETEALLEFASSGGGLVLVGRAGILDDELRPRAESPIETWLGRHLGPEAFRAERAGARAAYFPSLPEDPSALADAIRWAAGGRFSVEVRAPRWVACEFVRGDAGAVAVHFVNYAKEAAAGIEARILPAKGLGVPATAADTPADEPAAGRPRVRATWTTVASEEPLALEARAAPAGGDRSAREVAVAVPNLEIYGLLELRGPGI